MISDQVLHEQTDAMRPVANILGHVAGAVAAMFDAAIALTEGPARLFGPFAHTVTSRTLTAPAHQASALLHFAEHTMHDHQKRPPFGLHETVVDGRKTAVREEVVLEKPYCNLLHFKREGVAEEEHPKVLMVAPLSGHYATLLRGTVKEFLPDHDVHITDWKDVRDVHVKNGTFDLDDYVDYLTAMMRHLGPNTHVIAVCQPCPATLAAISRLEAAGDPCVPRSMTLVAGPVDTRISPTEVNSTFKARGIEWFDANIYRKVPLRHAGSGQDYMPGEFQLAGFMGMNLDRHTDAYHDYFKALVKGDGDGIAKHKDFYEEYLAVMGIPKAYLRQTQKVVFLNHDLPEGRWMYRGEERIDPSVITRCALMTVEGTKDDITGLGQTQAAHALCTGIPAHRHQHIVAPVGHYGTFNGSRFRQEIAPAIKSFIGAHDARDLAPARCADRTLQLIAS